MSLTETHCYLDNAGLLSGIVVWSVLAELFTEVSISRAPQSELELYGYPTN